MLTFNLKKIGNLFNEDKYHLTRTKNINAFYSIDLYPVK